MNKETAAAFDAKKLREYLSEVHGSEIDLDFVRELGEISNEKLDKGVKGFGYGKPYLIEFTVNGKRNSVVLETMRGNIFGHEFAYDRAQSLLMAHSLFSRLPRHARSIDVGVFMKDGCLRSVGNYEEFFILMEKVDGMEYYKDLERIRDYREVTDIDMERCQVLSDYLVEIHKIKKDSPDLYRRRIRELLGHGECIMGLIDSYPSKLNFTTNEELESIEKRCIQWRWKLKKEANRLCQVHGDFHPWNILFNDRVELSVLDRSRGEWGEPADDVAAMTINYLFFSLQAYGSLEDPFKVLYQNFLNNYIHKTGDEEILSVIQPYYVWRALVVASPIWYPNLNYDLRRKLFNFINNLLESETLNPSRINSYLE
jgi:thiamine kinase-like enzyme